MDWPVIVVKLTGVALLATTVRSIYRHIRGHRKKAGAGASDQQSLIERILNSLLLYLWYAFMLAFSGGMILNN